MKIFIRKDESCYFLLWKVLPGPCKLDFNELVSGLSDTRGLTLILWYAKNFLTTKHEKITFCN